MEQHAAGQQWGHIAGCRVCRLASKSAQDSLQGVNRLASVIQFHTSLAIWQWAQVLCLHRQTHVGA